MFISSFSLSDIESQIRDIQEKKKQVQLETDKGVGLLESGYFDTDLYGGNDPKGKYEGYVTSIAPNEDEEDDEDEGIPLNNKRSVNAPAALLNDIAQVSYWTTPCTAYEPLDSTNFIVYFQSDKEYDPFAGRRRQTIAEKEDEYRQRRRLQIISPERLDPFADGRSPTPFIRFTPFYF